MGHSTFACPSARQPKPKPHRPGGWGLVVSCRGGGKRQTWRTSSSNRRKLTPTASFHTPFCPVHYGEGFGGGGDISTPRSIQAKPGLARDLLAEPDVKSLHPVARKIVLLYKDSRLRIVPQPPSISLQKWWKEEGRRKEDLLIESAPVSGSGGLLVGGGIPVHSMCMCVCSICKGLVCLCLCFGLCLRRLIQCNYDMLGDASHGIPVWDQVPLLVECSFAY